MGTAIVSVSYNTRELTALLIWSLHRVLDGDGPRPLIVDNGSVDGSLEMLRRASDSGLCELVENDTNLGHGPALNLAVGSDYVRGADRVWILDSDCVITRPDALTAAVDAHPAAAVVGESHWDQWHRKMRFELYSLLLRTEIFDGMTEPFADDGDPAWHLLSRAESTGLTTGTFPFTEDGYLVHLGRGSLAAVAAGGDIDNPLYEWAVEHHEPHYGGLREAAQRHRQVLERFRQEVGPDLDLSQALAR